MNFHINRNDLLSALQSLISVVERRQTMPILGNFLLQPSPQGLTITASDLDTQMVATVFGEVTDDNALAVPARKLYDICRGLPDDTPITGKQDGDRLNLRCGRSRFTLSTLNGENFPLVSDIGDITTISLDKHALAKLITKTQFAMAHQDVRYYLNGLLFSLSSEGVRAVATDGHRLALCEVPQPIEIKNETQIIVPRKAVTELYRLMERATDSVDIEIGTNHIRLQLDNIGFTSKLIDGRFPDYRRVIPEAGDKHLRGNTQEFRQSLARAAILSNEKFRGIRLQLAEDQLRIEAHNPENEVAEEEFEGNFEGQGIEIGFNVTYLLDALGVLEGERFTLSLTTPDNSGLLLDDEDEHCRYVIMPMRL